MLALFGTNKLTCLSAFFCALFFLGFFLAPTPMLAEATYPILESQASSPIALDGEWEFVWNQFLPPGFSTTDVSSLKTITIPRTWNKLHIDGEPIGSDGFATFRWQGQWVGDPGLLGIHLPRIFTAYRLYVNGEKLATVGTAGESRAESRPEYFPQTLFVPVEPGSVELVFHVSNFHHRSGGLVYSIKAGPADVMLTWARNRLGYDLILFGSLVIMGLYHLVVYLFRSRQKSFLYFGVFCTLVSLRTLLVGDMFFIHMFPHVPWEWMHRLQTLTYYLGVGVIMKFFLYAFPNQVNHVLVQGINIVTGLFGVMVLLLQPRWFTLFNPAFQAFTLLVILYMLYVFWRVLKQRELGAMFTAAGAMALILAVVNDLLYLSILRADNGTVMAVFQRDNLSSLGLLLFVLAQSLVLSLRYTGALEEAASAQESLRRLNEELETKVAERTRDLVLSRDELAEQKSKLEEANATLARLSTTDPLTGLANRRCFDETLEREWRRALRRSTPLGVLFVDIDDFKPINDTYGHSEGDRCLQALADVLRSHARRSGDLAARFGGEEFVVLLPNLPGAETERLAHGIRQEISEHRIPLGNGSHVQITVSIGAAVMVPEQHQSSQVLVQRADQAMYRAKNSGKDRVVMSASNGSVHS